MFYICKHLFTTYKDIVKNMPFKLYNTTLKKILNSMHIGHWITKKRLKIGEEEAKKCFQWALAHKDWSWEEYSPLI